MATLVVLSGCPQKTPPEDAPSEAATAEAKAASRRVRQENCERRLNGVLEAFSPERVDADIDRATTLTDLNLWRKSCANDVLPGGVSAVASDEDLRERLLPEDLREAARGEDFTEADGGHLAESLLLQRIAAGVLDEAERQGQRPRGAADVATALFDFAVLQIAEIPQLGTGLPVSLRETWQLGFGSSADVAAAFMGLLRQQRIDAYIVAVPVPTEQGAIAGYELVGVTVETARQQDLADDASPDADESPNDSSDDDSSDDDTPNDDSAAGTQVLLFDPQLGLALPSLARPGEIATLDEALADDAVLRQFDLGGLIYPVTAERLAQRKIKFVGTPSLLAPRVGLLQYSLPASQRVELYDSLGQSRLVAEGQGFIDRVAAATDTPLDRIEPWRRGRLDLRPTLEPDSPAAQLLEQQRLALRGPVQVKLVKDEGGTVIGVDLEPPQTPLREGRISQVMGDVRAAAGVFLQARVARSPLTDIKNLPEELEVERRRVNNETATAAEYYNAIAQAQAGQRDSAIKGFEQFISRRESPLAILARRPLANLLADADRKDEAIAAMQTLAANGLLSVGDFYRLKTWGAAVPTTAELIEARDRAAQAAQTADDPETPEPGDDAEKPSGEMKTDDAKKPDDAKSADDADDDSPSDTTKTTTSDTPEETADGDAGDDATSDDATGADAGDGTAANDASDDDPTGDVAP